MSNNSGNAGLPRQSPSWFRRMTRSTRNKPHLEISTKGKPEWIDEKKPEPMWVPYMDLVTSESEQNIEAPMEEESSGYQMESDPSEEKSEEEEEEEEEPEEEEGSDQEYTSKYKPVEYPIFPTLKWGTEDEPDKWGLLSPAWGLRRTAPEPPKSPENAPKSEILLRGPDTYYPGSPGYLPESIPSEKWSEEVIEKGLRGSIYQKMVKYAAKTWKLRVPTNTKEVMGDDQMRIDLIDRDADGWYSGHVESKLPYKPVEYPIFPEDFYETENPKDNIGKFIELRGKDTVLPGSPGRLPEKIPVAAWWHEFYLHEGEDQPNFRMIEYSQKTWKDRIPLEEAKRRGIKLNQPMSKEESEAWYQSLRKGGDT